MIGARMSDLKNAAVVAVDQLLPDDPKEGHEEDIRISMVSYNHSPQCRPVLSGGDGHQPLWHKSLLASPVPPLV